ncbi:hypothetical protein B566_EDAN011763 [Ephemera danica]|nr:hypothetical protein B566_EDAN011763 [Ephemera danica]
MAERGAFLTSTAISKPSVFEVLAQESLAATIHPALKRIANFLASYNPQRFGWILNWFEEIFLCVNYSVQQHYIRTHEGSFAETFYGMRRFALGLPGARLPLRERRLSLLLIVVLDYTTQKLQILLDQWKSEPQATDSVKSRLLRAHRMAHVAWKSVSLATLLSYMTGRTDYHNLLLRMAGVGLQSTPDETEPPRDLSHLGYGQASPQLYTKTQLLSTCSWFRRGVSLIGPGLARCLEIAAFTLQFLQWWHIEGPRPQLTALPTPKAPAELPGAVVYAGLCPICLQTRRIDTVLPISGFVFCYRCIAVHLGKEGKCPVTNYPAKATDLVRIYADS